MKIHALQNKFWNNLETDFLEWASNFVHINTVIRYKTAHVP